MSKHNPYVGLRPFEAEDSLFFFGRDEQIIQLLERMHSHRFVAVVGGSGSGKSSLVRAGLLPRLRAGYLVKTRSYWDTAIMKPGLNPLYHLSNALCESTEEAEALREQVKEAGAEVLLDQIKKRISERNANFLLLVDQFEELFRFASSHEGPAAGKRPQGWDEAAEFVNLLLEMAAQEDLPVYIILTMRSDFIGDCVQFFGLPEALNKSQYLVPRLNRTQHRLVIEGPARLAGIQFQASLVSRLLNEIEHRDDQLPLLQHLLMRTWDYEQETDQSGVLDLQDYEAVGGVDSALSEHAEEVLRDLSEQEREQVRILFQALTTTDEAGRKVRRPARLSELQALTGLSAAACTALLDKFIEGNRSFLVKSKLEDDPNDLLIDISHESLIRQWDTLKKWVEQEAEAAAVYRDLQLAMTRHADEKRDTLSEPELVEVRHWMGSFGPTPLWATRYPGDFAAAIAFFEQSEAAFAERQKAIAAAERQKKNNKLLLLGLIVVGALVFVAGYFWWEARGQSHIAHQAAALADSARTESEKNEERAVESAKEAERAARDAAEARDIATKQQTLAELAGLRAREEQMKAEKARKEALIAAEKTERANLQIRENTLTIIHLQQAFQLNALAQLIAKTDETKALRVAELALSIENDPLIYDNAESIYKEGVFYKDIVTAPGIRHIFAMGGEYFMAEGTLSGDTISALTPLSEYPVYNREGAVIAEVPHEKLYTRDGQETVHLSPKGDKLLINAPGQPARLLNLAGDPLPFPDSERAGKGSALADFYDLDGSFYVVGEQGVTLFSPEGEYQSSYLQDRPELVTASQIAILGDFVYLWAKWDEGNKSRIYFLETEYEVNLGMYQNAIDFPFYVQYDFSLIIGKGRDLIKIESETDYAPVASLESDISTILRSEGGLDFYVGLASGLIYKMDAFGDISVTYKGHDAPIVEMAESIETGKLMSTAADGSVKIWDIPGSEIMQTRTTLNEVGALTAVLEYDQHVMVATGILDGIYVENLKKEEAKLIGTSQINYPIYALNSLADDRSIVQALFAVTDSLGNPDPHYIIFDVVNTQDLSLSDLKKVKATESKAYQEYLLQVDLWQKPQRDGKSDGVATIVWETSASGRHRGCDYTVAAAKDGMKAIAYDHKGDSTYILQADIEAPISAISISPDCKQVVIGTSSGALYKTTLATNKESGTLIGNQAGRINSIDWDPVVPGEILVSSSDQTLNIWQINRRSGKVRHKYEEIFLTSITQARYSADGTLVLGGTNNGEFVVWEKMLPVMDYLKSDNIKQMSRIEFEEWDINPEELYEWRQGTGQ